MAGSLTCESSGSTSSSNSLTANWSLAARSCDELVAYVLEQGKSRYRDLPWRYIDDPFAVLVSEVMLQQTQVARVEGYWRRFLDAFPTIDALASAAVSDVLVMWQGLGYNRRALALKRTADWCSENRAGTLPETYDELLALPGIGPATAAGVMAFAHNQPSCYVETNVRTVFLHELFPAAEQVRDRELEPFVRDAATCAFAQVDPRTWYYALLDVGAYLKTVTVNPSRRSAHYARQKAFEGSHRQKRSLVLQQVLAHDKGITLDGVFKRLYEAETAAGRDGVARDEFLAIVDELCREGFFAKDGELLISR